MSNAEEAVLKYIYMYLWELNIQLRLTGAESGILEVVQAQYLRERSDSGHCWPNFSRDAGQRIPSVLLLPSLRRLSRRFLRITSLQRLLKRKKKITKFLEVIKACIVFVVSEIVISFERGDGILSFIIVCSILILCRSSLGKGV